MAQSLVRKVAQAVRRKRHELSLTQAELAEASGVSRKTLIDLEMGRARGISLSNVDSILGVLDIEVTLGAKAGETDSPNLAETGERMKRAREEALHRSLELEGRELDG